MGQLWMMIGVLYLDLPIGKISVLLYQNLDVKHVSFSNQGKDGELQIFAKIGTSGKIAPFSYFFLGQNKESP